MQAAGADTHPHGTERPPAARTPGDAAGSPPPAGPEAGERPVPPAAGDSREPAQPVLALGAESAGRPAASGTGVEAGLAASAPREGTAHGRAAKARPGEATAGNAEGAGPSGAESLPGGLTAAGGQAVAASPEQPLCPLHRAPMQLVISREGKTLLLHKIEGEGYCNGTEVRAASKN